MEASRKRARARALLLDGHSLAYRAFFALPPDLRTTSGQVTNAVYGFTSMLIKALQDYKTDHVAVAFDRGRPSDRLALKPEYKAQRAAPPDEFVQQMGLIREVLKVLKIAVFEADNTEADDLIHVIGEKLAGEGADVIIVTADRDFFQMVGPSISLLMNRKGISDTVLYDEAGVAGRYGFGPEHYLDYAALRGDPSDNIAGVAGIGDKTASKLIQTYGSLESVFEHLDELAPRARASLAEARQRILENREVFRLRSAGELAAAGVDPAMLDVELESLQRGEWDMGEVRRLFDVLEFRTLLERLASVSGAPPQALAGEGLSGAVKRAEGEAGAEDLAREMAGMAAPVVVLPGDPRRPRNPPDAIALAVSGGASVLVIEGSKGVAPVLAAALGSVPIVTHAGKDALLRLRALGVQPAGVAMDTELAAYLIDPARGSYRLDDLARTYLKRDLKLSDPPKEGQQELAFASPGPLAAVEEAGLQAMAVSELAGAFEKELRQRGAWDLLVDLELPLAAVLADMELGGVRVDAGYLRGLAGSIDSDLARIEEEIYTQAGEPFNINSPPQLRRILYQKLGLKPGKKTKTGFSTDAGVLESLRDQHPVIDSILAFRERAKLKSTYIDALPPLLDPATGRLHCRFNQTVAATGRLSTDSPNLQNIPIRTKEGREIRRAFIPGEGQVLMVADYSQIELRVLAHLSEDPELMAAFERGEDIHKASIARALGIGEDEVGPELRSIGKMVSYGVTYGMGPFGLAQRLHIPIDQARMYISGFFGQYPRVREYLDDVVAAAAQEGHTTTILGRRRYLPELSSRNPRVRSLGERMALNAPIQGSAADIIKLAMVRVHRSLDPAIARMVLTVHDELVLEVAAGEVDQVGPLVRAEMEGAVDLKVPMRVDMGWGPNWTDAKAG